MNKKILSFIEKVIKKNDLKLVFFDVGSRNGILELADLASFTETYGFEPNPEEYQKLLSGKTDAFLLCGVKVPNFKKISYFPYALNNFSGRQEFFVTPGPGACGLKEPNLENLNKIVWKGKKYKKNFGEDIFASFKKIEVEVQTLDSFVSQHSINYIDYLKIDVEGSEYEVLEGAKNTLPKIGVIKAEVCLVPFRKEQKLFSEVDVFLRDLGFELLKYETNPAQIGYKEREKPFYYTPVDFPDSFGQPLSCDAIYINRNLSDSNRLIAQAAVLLEKNYIDEAFYILKNKVKINNQQFLDLLKTIHLFGETKGQKLRGIGYYLVDKAVKIIKKILRK